MISGTSIFHTIDETLHILLADDDKDDCLLFKNALDELPLTVNLTTVHDGEQLMDLLTKSKSKLPDVLFLDLNMPRKSGYTALGLIKKNKNLAHLPVVVLSTDLAEKRFAEIFSDVANYCIRKPNEFTILKSIIYESITLILEGNKEVQEKENFA